MANETNQAVSKINNNVIEFVSCKLCLFERKALDNKLHRCLQCIVAIEDAMMQKAVEGRAREEKFMEERQEFMKAVASPIDRVRNWMDDVWYRVMEKIW